MFYHCFGFALVRLCDWLKKTLVTFLANHIRSKFKTNRDLLARVFPRLAPASCFFAASSDWFFGSSACVVIVRSDYFDFGFAKLN